MSVVHKAKNIKKIRNMIIRLSIAVILIVSVFFALKGLGFFEEAIVYDPVSEFCYHSPVSPSGQHSYSGSSDFSTVSTGLEENNSATFNDGILGKRTKRTEVLGDGKDVFTVMIYMCGSDMEDTFGWASDDIDEIKAATSSGKLNVIIQTGGAEDWDNNSIKPAGCQRYKIANGKIKQLASENDSNIINYASLTSFLQFCKKNYPANRYALIFWGHSGGTNGGYGYNAADTSTDSITIDEINQSLYASEMKFDFIGFDAGFMATYDTAYVMNFYADYLIASQEAVPSCGWNYTNWLSAIAKNSSIDTTEIAKIIIDDYITDCRRNSAAASMTLIDLVDFNNLLVPSMADFSDSINAFVLSDKYSHVASSRVASHHFGNDSVDLMEFAYRIDSPESDKLVEALKATVKYNCFSEKLINTNGLSLYFPFYNLDVTNDVINIFHRININGSYLDAISSFANLEIGGRLFFDDSELSYVDNRLTNEEFEHFTGTVYNESTDNMYKWVDSALILSFSDFYNNNHLDASTFDINQESIVEGDIYNVFSITEDEWKLIADVSVESYAYDKINNRYSIIGSDVSELDYLNSDKRHLIANYRSSWLTIDGIDVCAQLVSSEYYNDSDKKLTYKIPIIVSHTDIAEESFFVKEEPESVKFVADLYVTLGNFSGGYADKYAISHVELSYNDSDISPRSKTMRLNEGDIIIPTSKYADNNFDPIDISISDSDVLGSITYSENTKISLKDMSGRDGFRTYMVFTDIYGNVFRVEISENLQEIN